MFDRDGDGLITEEELRLTMNNLGEPITAEEVKAMIEEADLDGEQEIYMKVLNVLHVLSFGGQCISLIVFNF